MKQIRIKASEIIADIRAGKDDRELMEKHGLSVRSLPKVKRELVRKGWMTEKEVHVEDSTIVSPKITIKADEFLVLFRERSDDFVLMRKYKLTMDQLKKIYDTLIAKGLLSEYEYNCRDIKAPELDDFAVPETEETTAVNLVQEFSDDLKQYIRNSLRSHSGNNDDHHYADGNGAKQSDRKRVSTRKPDTARVEHVSLCPACGKPSDASSPDCCRHCGLVFCKAKRLSRHKRVAIWEDHWVR
jgi:hypothetical protein